MARVLPPALDVCSRGRSDEEGSGRGTSQQEKETQSFISPVPVCSTCVAAAYRVTMLVTPIAVLAVHPPCRSATAFQICRRCSNLVLGETKRHLFLSSSTSLLTSLSTSLRMAACTCALARAELDDWSDGSQAKRSWSPFDICDGK